MEGEAALELLAVVDEDVGAPLERLRPGDAAALLVVASIPDDHLTLTARALEVVVGDLVVLDLYRQSFHRRVHRRPFRHGPGTHHAIDLEPKVEVVGGRGMLLDDEGPRTDAADRELLVGLVLEPIDVELRHRCAGRPLPEDIE